MPLFSKVQTCSLAAATAFASLALFTPAAAAQQPQTAQPSQEAPQERNVGELATGSTILVIGAIKDPSDHDAPVAEDRRVPELPVVYEDAKPAATARAGAVPPASAAR